MYDLVNPLATVLGISALILVHECGHFVAARLVGMRVLRFSLGFGPALWQRRMGDTHYQIAAVPLGGFVQVQGMGAPEPGETVVSVDSYTNHPRWQRALFIFAGPATNWLLAAVCIGLLAISVGFETYDEGSTVLGRVLPDRPAAMAGLQVGDRVLSVAGQKTEVWLDIVREVRQHPGEPISILVDRGGEEVGLTVTPVVGSDSGHGQIGVEPRVLILRTGALGALQTGVKGAWLMTNQQLSLLWGLVAGSQEAELTGLPGIVKMVSSEMRRGLRNFLGALASLSITLFLLNLLPIPALDGSRLLLLGVEVIRRRPLNHRVESMIHGVGFLLLLALLLFVSIRDLI